MPVQTERRSRYRLKISIQSRMDGRELFRPVIKQVIGQRSPENQHVNDLRNGKRRQRAVVELENVAPEERPGDQHADHVVPARDGHRAEPHEFGLDEYRVRSGGDDADQHEQVAQLLALHFRPSVAQNQYGRACYTHPDTDDLGPVEPFPENQRRHDERNDRRHRSQRRGIERIGVFRAPQHHEFMPVNDQHRRNQNPDEIPSRNPEALIEKRQRDETNRRKKDSCEKKGLERHVVPDDRYEKRKVHPEQHVRDDQRQMSRK